jgi:heptose-I-phosphate ethanolaminephosphotransferase
MGSHAVYRARYPPEAEFFKTIEPTTCGSATQKQAINDYDNSVRFSDSVVGRIVEAARHVGGEAFVLYLSDHGEEVYDFRDVAMHGNEILSPYMVEIPLVVWLSPEYRRNHADFVGQLERRLNRPYTHSHFAHSVADLARLSFVGMDRTRSIFAEEFIPRERLVAGRRHEEFRRNWAPDATHAGGKALLGCSPAPSRTAN